MMLFNSRKRSGMSSMFLLGMTAGVVVGSFLVNKWMGNKEMSNGLGQPMQPMEKQVNNQNKTDKEFTQSFENLENTNKQDLFETFLNGTDEELAKKSSELN